MPRKSGRFLKEDFICMDFNFEFVERRIYKKCIVIQY